MIKLNIQLFGGSGETTSSVEDVKNHTQGSIDGGAHYVGKVNAETKAGQLYNNNAWDKAASGNSNKQVRADIQRYFGAQGVTDVSKKLTDEKYLNTLHVIESSDDEGKKMMYVVHIGPDGTMRVSEPGDSQKVLNHVEAMYANEELSDTDNGYFKGANKVNGTVEWGTPPPPAGKDDSGKDVFVNDKGDIVDKEGNPVDKFTDTDGKVIEKDDEGIFKDETGVEVTLTPPIRDNSNALDNAYNQYYNELFSRDKGTLGRDILDNNISLFEKEAENMGILAESSLQNQAMAQAQGIRQVTDAIKNERMAQLRSGMSESQLADRELQMLMGSVNNFSNQAQMASQERLAAGLGANTAREQAFNQYIDQTTALGQNASANYASEVGDLYYKAYQYQKGQQALGKNVSMEEAIELMSGQRDK